MKIKNTNKQTKVGEYHKLFIVHKKTRTIIYTTMLIDSLKYLIPLVKELSGFNSSAYELVITKEGYKILNGLFDKLWHLVKKSRIEAMPFHRAFFSSKTDDKGDLTFFALQIKIDNLANYLTITKRIMGDYVFFENKVGNLWQQQGDYGVKEK